MTAARVYPARPIKRRRRTQDQIAGQREKIEVSLPPDTLRVAKVAGTYETRLMNWMAHLFRSDACGEGGSRG